MKRLFTMILLLCSLAGIAHAQRITRNFQNVPMSDALKYIQQQTGNYKIVFIYNELEDFTITTHVKNKPMSRTNLFLMPFARSSVSIPSR